MLRRGVDLVVISIGAFADLAFYEEVQQAARENVHSPNVSAGRTKQAFVLLSQKVLANLETETKA